MSYYGDPKTPLSEENIGTMDFDRKLISRDTSYGATTNDSLSRSTSLGMDDSFSFDKFIEEIGTTAKGITDSVAAPAAAAVGIELAAPVSAGPEESTKAQQNIDLAEILAETMQPFFVEILECYEEGFKYISTTPFNTVLADSEKYDDPIIGYLVDRPYCFSYFFLFVLTSFSYIFLFVFCHQIPEIHMKEMKNLLFHP